MQCRDRHNGDRDRPAATDAERDTPITYQWTQLDDEDEVVGAEDPDHVTLSAPTAASTSFVAPQGEKTLFFRVTATDSLDAVATGTVTVNVLANNPPVLTAGNAQAIERKITQSVQLNGAATDPDNSPPSANHVLTYAWTQVDAAGASAAMGQA